MECYVSVFGNVQSKLKRIELELEIIDKDVENGPVSEEVRVRRKLLVSRRNPPKFFYSDSTITKENEFYSMVMKTRLNPKEIFTKSYCAEIKTQFECK